MDKKKTKTSRAPVPVKRSRRTSAQRAVAELQKILHRYRAHGEARLRVLATIAAEGISKPVGRAVRRALRPDVVQLTITRMRIRKMVRMKKASGSK